ncbi:hypothetical protein DFH08DRAFT_811868 [Mycena albidolilacea]|uniref:Uncharacterized protein n=1 Tax=Mycena albidolilacea TaxID=1033008 RepID=A0AAD6ZUT4_9AGAR|nr:hypothetical protein DFH08DRAFT_811868 [Mycena albidolilacea]
MCDERAVRHFHTIRVDPRDVEVLDPGKRDKPRKRGGAFAAGCIALAALALVCTQRWIDVHSEVNAPAVEFTRNSDEKAREERRSAKESGRKYHWNVGIHIAECGLLGVLDCFCEMRPCHENIVTTYNTGLGAVHARLGVDNPGDIGWGYHQYEGDGAEKKKREVNFIVVEVLQETSAGERQSSRLKSGGKLSVRGSLGKFKA